MKWVFLFLGEILSSNLKVGSFVWICGCVKTKLKNSGLQFFFQRLSFKSDIKDLLPFLSASFVIIVLLRFYCAKKTFFCLANNISIISFYCNRKKDVDVNITK
jgi:hypothetical protein